MCLRYSGFSGLCPAFRKIFFWTAILLFAGLVSCSQENRDAEKVKQVMVRAEDYEKMDYKLVLNFSGEAKARKKVDMSFNIPGKIDRLFVDEGEAVKKGKLLAQLEQDSYLAAKDQSHARWEKAKRDYERGRRLLEKGTIKEQMVQDAHTALKAAKAALDIAELNVEHCLLFAPFNGHIAFRYGEEREMVASGQPVFTLIDLSRMIIEIGVPEKSIGRIREGQMAHITFDAIQGKTFTGRVTHVAVSSLPNTRLFKVEIAVPNPELAVKPGMTASLAVATDEMKDVYVFSLDVAVLRNGRRVLFLALDGKAKEVTLEDFTISGDKIIVRDPLPQNGRIITSGQDVLFDGMEISILHEGRIP